MIKIDNKGWSLNTMIIFMFVLTLVIILVSVLVYNYGIERDSPNPLFNTTVKISS